MKRLLLLLLVLAALGFLVWYATRAAEAQGAVYNPGNVITVVSALPGACADGNLVVLSAPAPAVAGVLYRCTGGVFAPLLPSAPKAITGMANGVFTDVLTVSVPNVATAALIEVLVVGALGAGGAVGPYEAAIGATAYVTVTRTPGLAAVKNVVIDPAPDARVAGGAAISQDFQLSAVSGANSATQQFAIQYRLSRGTGNATNHLASVTTRVLSPIAPIVTVQ